MFSSSFGLEDYVEMLNDIYKNMDDEYLTLSCSAEGKTLIYTCTFKVDNVTKEEAQSILDSEAEDFKTIVDQTKEANIPCDKVVFEYRAIDNELLASREEYIK